MNWIKKIQQSIREQKTLEDRFFTVVVMVGLAIVLVSIAVTIFEGIGFFANVGTSIGGIMLLAVIYVAFVRKQMDIARIMLCYVFNCVVIPIDFFSCGGIDSGMPLYMLAGIFTLVPVLKGRQRVLGMIIAFLVDTFCIITSYFLTPGVNVVPTTPANSKILVQLSLESRVIDMICSLILVSLYIIITTAMVMDAYQKERASREALLVKLDDLSKRDELTGLYNRRELFHFLENTPITDGSYHLCMLDIDHFKNVNDTYGHVFGDMVLRKLAEIMKEEIKTEGGELVARYGGEEFLIVFKEKEKARALERLDLIRKRFVAVKWENAADLVTSISGGMVSCASFQNYAEAISQADKLLYRAKENGRNRLEA